MADGNNAEATVLRYLRETADLSGARVLDIGCGAGGRTREYAARADRVVAIDPDADLLAAACRDRPPALGEKILLAQARGEALPFRDGAFDAVLLLWSF